MSPLLVALLLVQLVPLFLGSWRTSLLGLGAQALLTAWIAWRQHPGFPDAEGLVSLFDLVLVRGLWAPWLLRRVLTAHGTRARHDVIPPNLLSWTFALAAVLLAFSFAEDLEPTGGPPQALAAVVTTGVLLGFLVLATQPRPFGQMVGALRIENAVALLEVGGARHHAPLGVQLGQVLVFVLTVAFYRWFLDALGVDGARPAPPSGAEGPTL